MVSANVISRLLFIYTSINVLYRNGQPLWLTFSVRERRELKRGRPRRRNKGGASFRKGHACVTVRNQQDTRPSPQWKHTEDMILGFGAVGFLQARSWPFRKLVHQSEAPRAPPLLSSRLTKEDPMRRGKGGFIMCACARPPTDETERPVTRKKKN